MYKVSKIDTIKAGDIIPGIDCERRVIAGLPDGVDQICIQIGKNTNQPFRVRFEPMNWMYEQIKNNNIISRDNFRAEFPMVESTKDCSFSIIGGILVKLGYAKLDNLKKPAVYKPAMSIPATKKP
jgi:hypothetical protein